MRKEFINYFRNPKTGNTFVLKNEVIEGDRIKAGILFDEKSGRECPVVNYIPRFVEPHNYADSFGLEWNTHFDTQYDYKSKHSISQERFEKETKWGSDLTGQLILEAGCGSGRFTAYAADTGATVLSFDYSNAVEANYKSNGQRENICISQANIFDMPFEENSFDKIYCIGVIQHTPDPEKALKTLVRYLKPGGSIVTDIYLKSFITCVVSPKYIVRAVTRHMNPAKLYKLCVKYVNLMWPLARLISRIPAIGKSLNWLMLVADYSRLLPDADDATLKEWAYLDTFDMLSPKYDIPATLKTYKRWHEEAGLVDIDVHYGYNGIEGRAKKRVTE
ncbi:MAG: hypothetical protein A2020_10810 [Lentisphaerae bacterium GWF2_45_14]|nr:MAG: hypothetical protein A2020_10810 [Lentisphaerae bacterium GWF2_45_14]